MADVSVVVPESTSTVALPPSVMACVKAEMPVILTVVPAIQREIAAADIVVGRNVERAALNGCAAGVIVGAAEHDGARARMMTLPTPGLL